MVQRMKELEQRRRTLQDEEIDWSTITLPPTEVGPQRRFTQLRLLSSKLVCMQDTSNGGGVDCQVVALSGHALDMIVIHDLSLDDLYTTALDPGHK